MFCRRCGREKDPVERAWVTLVASDVSQRPSYCPDCVAELVADGWKEKEDAESG